MSPQHPLPSGFGAKTTRPRGDRRAPSRRHHRDRHRWLRRHRPRDHARARRRRCARDRAGARHRESDRRALGSRERHHRRARSRRAGHDRRVRGPVRRGAAAPAHQQRRHHGRAAVARRARARVAARGEPRRPLPAVRAPARRAATANGARVVALSSRGHVRSAFDFDDPNFEHRPYDKMVAYGQSKTANVLFAVEADRRYQRDGIRAFSLHPGAILETDLARNYDPEELKLVVERARRIGSFKTVEQGAATTIWCATSSQLDGPRRRVLRELRHRAGQDRGRRRCPALRDRSGDRTAAVGVERALAVVTPTRRTSDDNRSATSRPCTAWSSRTSTRWSRRRS